MLKRALLLCTIAAIVFAVASCENTVAGDKPTELFNTNWKLAGFFAEKSIYYLK